MSDRRSRIISLTFLLFLGGVVVAGVLIAQRAETAILQSQSGEVTSAVLDPTEPGFRAFTTSTDTALVLHTAVVSNAGAQLIGVSLLAEADASAGGSVITVPRTFVDQEASGVPLADIFSSGGVDGVVSELNATFGIGFGEVVVLDAASWTSLMVADLPLTLTLREDLVEAVDPADPDGATQVVLASGTRAFTLTEIATIAAHQNPGEPSLGVALRHQQIWTAWISRTAGADERPELLTQETGFVELIGSLASAEVSYRTAETATVIAERPEDTTYEAAGDVIRDVIAEIVPFPESAEPGDRPTVFLLDRSLGVDDLLPVVSGITRSGGLVTIIGNTDGVTQMEPEVQVHDPAAAEVAAEIAERLGYGEPRTVSLDEATTAITVVS